MSTKKTTGNRWATAVEGAADVLLDTGKSNGGEPSVLPSEEQPQVRIMPVSDPPNLQNKKVPSVQKKNSFKNSKQKYRDGAYSQSHFI